MGNSLKQSIISGVFWQGLERVGSYGIGFVVSIILARRLSPEEFGVIAIMLVFITLSNVFVDSGFSTALIQKKNMEEIDCCSAFYINIVMGLILYGILYLAAPFIADFYETEKLTLYLHVFSLIIIIRSFSLIQNTLLRKRMLFHLSFRITWVAMVISGAVGIIMAYSNCGVWSLIAQQITSAIVTALLQWLLVKWRPQWMFDWKRTKEMFHFGWKVFCSGFLDTLYNDIYSIVIGKIADLKVLSFYNRGQQYPKLGMDIINTTIGTVMLPAFSELQDDKKRMKELAARSLKIILYCVAPALAFIFVFADSITVLLLTEKWLPSVIFMRLCCLTFLFWPFHTVNLQVIMASGHSNVYLVLEIIKKVQAVVAIAITYRFGVVAMVAAGVGLSVLGVFENAWYNKKLINYTAWQQILDTSPAFFITVIVASASYFASYKISIIWAKIAVGAIIFGLLYFGISFATGFMPHEIKSIVKRGTHGLFKR